MASQNSILNNVKNNEFSVGNKDNNTVGATINLLKDRAGAAINSGDVIAEINFAGFDGTNYVSPSAGIISTSSGTIGAGRVAANLEFFTHPDAASAAVQRMTISPTGLVTVNAADSGISFTSAGINTYPAQPAFLAAVTGVINNVTGDGTIYTVLFGTEKYDVGGNYNNATGVFTAPITGKYHFSTTIGLANIGAGHTLLIMSGITTQNGFRLFTADPAATSSGGTIGLNGSFYETMDAGDTCVITIQVSNSTLTVNLNGVISAVNYRSFFSGILVA